MHWLPQDLRYAVRQLRKSPGFTLVAVLTLALGIGANTAIASAVYAILLRSLPFHDAGRLVLIKETHPQAGIISASYRDFLDWRAQSKSFENLAAYSDEHHNFAQLVIDGQPQSVRDAFATADLFPALGIQPELGRGFLPTEDSDAGIHVAVISHPLWESRFARDPSIIGRAVQVNGQSFTVAGMMPAGRQYPVDTDLWLPFSQLGQDERTSRQYHVVDVIGRLRPGVSREDAAVELNTIAARLAQTYPATNRTIGVRLTPLRDALVGQLRPTLLALFGSVALVLFIACANIANLLLVRATHREREIALRMALGASRGRLLRQFLVESLVLSFVGAASGIALAAAAMPLLSFGLAHVSNQPFAFAQPISLNLPVLVFTALLAVATGVTFSLFPALSVPPVLNGSLRDGQRTATAGRKPLRSLLAAGEMALAVVVLFTAALLLRSFQKLLAIDPGFRTDHLLAVKIDLPDNLYATPQQVETFSTRLQEQIERIPGVASAAITNALPLSPSHSLTRFAVAGAPPPAPGNFPVTQIRTVSPSYFRTLGIGLRAGRSFEQKDVDDQTGTYIVNEAFARRYLAGRDPVGSRLMMDVMTAHPTAVPVIGVVNNAKDLGVDASTEPVIYTAGYPNGQILLVRTNLDPLVVAPAIRQTVSSLDRKLGVSDLKTMDGVLSDSLARPRLSALVLGFFAFLSVGLAAIGVYGVLAFVVIQRTREIGVRLALGAQRSQVRRLFLKHGALLVLAGAAVGLAGALVAGRLLGAILFQTAPADPFSVVVTTAVLVVIGIAAVCIPAQRASEVDPMVALRAE
jgi:predicted permease